MGKAHKTKAFDYHTAFPCGECGILRRKGVWGWTVSVSGERVYRRKDTGCACCAIHGIVNEGCTCGFDEEGDHG